MGQLSECLSDCSSEVARAIGRICERREWSDLHALLSQYFDPNFKFGLRERSEGKLLDERRVETSAVSVFEGGDRRQSGRQSLRVFAGRRRHGAADQGVSAAM